MIAANVATHTGRVVAWLVVIGVGLSAARLALARPAAPVPTFREAYQRERAELRAEQQALEQQLTRLKQDNAAKEDKLRGEVEQKTAALASLRRDADAAEDRLTALQEQVDVGGDQSDGVDSTLEAAALSLKKLGREVSIEGEQEAVLGRIYQHGVELVAEVGTVRVVDGSFFDIGGIEQHGRLVQIGRVAALGVADGVGGVLTLAPGGGFRLVDETRAAEARELVDGGVLAAVPVRLFDPLSTTATIRPSRTWLDVANAGGIIAWVIVGLAVLVILIVLERIVTLSLISRRARALVSQAATWAAATSEHLAAECSHPRGALGRVMGAVFEQRNRPREQLEDVATEAIYREMPRLERLLPLLGVIAAIAPLLGLLGTVTGMISTFEVITEHGTGDPKLLSGGISEALITTEFGLIVAVPTLLAHHALGRWSDRVVASLQAGSLSLINRLDRWGASDATRHLEEPARASHPDTNPAERSPDPDVAKNAEGEPGEVDGD